MQTNSRFLGDKLSYGANSQAIRAKCTTPFLDNTRLMKDWIYQAMSKEFRAPKILKAPVIIESVLDLL
jgi:hypothetical protein